MVHRIWLVSLLLSFSEAALTVCPKEGTLKTGLKYHSDRLCDRAAYNSFKSSLNRHGQYRRFQAKGGISTVPDQKTTKCPANGALVDMSQPGKSDTGFDTVFFVENSASTPIVVSFLYNGQEVSAKNPKISPAIRDPDAILAPGAWMAVYAFEGHQFVAREVLKSGVAGNVLLQHRAGLIGVGQGSTNLDCPSLDVEPVINEARVPEFQRTPPQVHRPCNTMDIGFRNTANCPLHVYYVSGDGDSCREDFKFHLGVESVVDDFMWDWKSQTKFEGTFVGHSFHFRLASNPSVLVDTVTLAPVVVTDCPAAGVAVPVSSQSEAILTDVGRMVPLSSSNETLPDLVLPNATSLPAFKPQTI